MGKTKTIPVRKNVEIKDTWDLKKLFANDEAWEKAFKSLESKIGGYGKFRGKLGESPAALKRCLEFDVEVEKLAEQIGSYAFLKSCEDVADSTYQGMIARYTFAATRAGEAASYIAPEIQAMPAERLREFIRSAALKPFRFQLEKLLRYKPHILSESEERLLAMQGEVAGSASRIFGQLTDADFKFGDVRDEEGEKVELSQGSFRVFLESPKRAVRKAAFERFYRIYEDHGNTLAATLSSSVLQDVYRSRARNYPSAREAALFSDNVPVAVYDSLVKTVHDNLDTVYHYFDVRRKALGGTKLHFYDTYAPLVQNRKTDIPYSEAIETVCDSLTPLGTEYCKTLRDGLSGRWVDRYENKGKRSGAFSAGGYTGPPYILMNYKHNVLDSMFTLAHEAGHSMHTYFSARNQPFQSYQYTIFVAEVASTFNEQLLNHHLVDRAKNRKRRALLINREIDEIRGTIVRQTMFAEYEQILHAIAEAGEPLTTDRLRDEYRKLLGLYFGPKFALDEVLTFEGLRIPHFYNAFYVYKYATGLSAAIALSRSVLEDGAPARDRYLDFLKSGGSKYPLDQLRDAGVDLEKPEPVQAAMTRLKELVKELEDVL